MLKPLAIFARMSILDDRGGTQSESNKDRLQQRYTNCVLYYSEGFVHQIFVWDLVLFGKKWEKLPNDSAIYNTYKNGITIKRMIYVLTKLSFKSEEYVQHTSTVLIVNIVLVKLLIKFSLQYMKKPFHCINIVKLSSLFYIPSLVNNTYLVLYREKNTLIY